MRVRLAILIIIVSILGYNLWPFFDCFYQCIALTFVLSAWLLVLMCEKGTSLKRVLYIWLILTISNLLDELFFDPKKFGVNEYLFAAIIIAHQIYFHRNVRYRKR